MPILNYSTKIDVYSTIGTIQGILVKHGAKKILQEYTDEGRVKSLSFIIETPRGIRAVRLPANVEGVMIALKKQHVKSNIEQAERVAWRILKDWIEAQMAILEAEMVHMDEIFLPYMLDDTGQKTLYETYCSNQLRLNAE